jgi:hypothetical protein
MKHKIPLVLGLTLMPVVAGAQNAQFSAGHLAVLRGGDGVVSQALRQAPIFIDQFDPNGFNAAPSLTVAIPTNGPNAFFFNGHAATEGILSRSADHRLLVFGGYGGVNLLQMPGTPSLLDIQRGFCTVDAAGAIHTCLYRTKDPAEKMNPRGAATDGTNQFWGCGNSGATLYFNPPVAKSPVEFDSVENTRAMKIAGQVLYATLNGADGTAIDKPAGIYRFVNKAGDAVPLPQQADAAIQVVVPATAPYAKIAGFDLSLDKNVAYMADTEAGIQKYVKSGDAWKLAYNFKIPQNIPAELNHANGCFALAVDFSGPAPVIFATTTEGYNGSVNSNRVVRIVDTNAAAVVTTVAQAGSADIAFRGIDFTPETGPAVASKP